MTLKANSSNEWLYLTREQSFSNVAQPFINKAASGEFFQSFCFPFIFFLESQQNSFQYFILCNKIIFTEIRPILYNYI